MKVLFLTLIKINSIQERGIYTDLLRTFYDHGHKVFAVCPAERRDKKKTHLIEEKEGTRLNVQTLNLQKTNVIEKGLGTLAIEYQYLRAIKKYFSNIKFDLIIYSTPPITFFKIINFIKKRDNAYSYLLLKDIFPQNAIDMQMFKENSILHHFFKKKEKQLYNVSDAIGCMSLANKKYLLSHNNYISADKVEINPNSIAPQIFLKDNDQNKKIKLKYSLPLNAKLFIYGGNLGKPQGTEFLLETIQTNKNKDVFFVIVGSGTAFNSIEKWFTVNKPNNAILLAGLPKTDFDLLLNACHVGLIFLNRNFTIPNFPSRLLSYLEMKLPVIAATDDCSDIGDVLEDNNCGYKIAAGNLVEIHNAIDLMCNDEKKYQIMSQNAWSLLQNQYNVIDSYNLIKNRSSCIKRS